MKSIIFPLLFATSMCCSSDDTTTGAVSDSGSSSDNMESDGVDCCERSGEFSDEKQDVCAVSDPPRCIGCEGQPVLCQTSCVSHGKTVPCCLASGETIPCPVA